MRPIELNNQVYAYLEIFKYMTRIITEDGTEYITVNLRNVLYEYPDHIKRLIEDYAREYDVSIIWNNDKTDEDLNFGSFYENGYLIIFYDVELTETKLETNITWWFNWLAASGYTYTVEKNEGKWTITDIKFMWIS